MRRDRKASNGYTCDNGLCGGAVGHSHGRPNIKVHYPGNNSNRLVLQPLDSKAAYLQKARKGGGRPRNQPAVSGLNMNAVVCHQARKAELAARCGLDEVERQSRFARASGAANQDCPRAHQDRRGVNGGRGVHTKAYIAGSRTTKRAPRMRSSTIGSLLSAAGRGSRGAMRF
jgi:hypothetical protein